MRGLTVKRKETVQQLFSIVTRADLEGLEPKGVGNVGWMLRSPSSTHMHLCICARGGLGKAGARQPTSHGLTSTDADPTSTLNRRDLWDTIHCRSLFRV